MSIFQTRPFTSTGEVDNSISSSEKGIMLLENDERLLVCCRGDKSNGILRHSSQS